MGIYSGGTFRVGPPPSFSFTNNKVEYYPHTIDLWTKKGIWQNIRNKYRTLHGSAKGAEIIQKGLTYLNQYQPGSDKDSLTPEEKEIIQEVLGKKRLSLLQYAKGLSANVRGRNFEKDFAALVERLTLGTTSTNIGAKRQESPVVIKFNIDLSGTNITKGVYHNVPSQKDTYNAILDLIENQLATDFKEMLGEGLELEVSNIIQATQGTSLGRIIVRQSKGTGKVDNSVKFRSAIQFESTVSQEVQDLANELAGHTFSLKNYKGETLENWKGVSLGYANKFRFYGSFFQAATKSTKQLNFADLCTFIYASENSKNPVIERYLDWARYVYELTGLGQQDIADYLIINNSTTGNVQVYSVKELLKNMPDGIPGAKLQPVRSGGKEREKFIFSTS